VLARRRAGVIATRLRGSADFLEASLRKVFETRAARAKRLPVRVSSLRGEARFTAMCDARRNRIEASRDWPRKQSLTLLLFCDFERDGRADGTP
jgi:hypothetical protein